MQQTRKYAAASIPRALRQQRLGHIPLNCVIGSHATQSGNGAQLVFDVLMLPVREFQRIKTTLGMQYIINPVLQLGPAFTPSYNLSDVRQVEVPPAEPNPEAYARRYFQQLFNLPVQPPPPPASSPPPPPRPPPLKTRLVRPGGFPAAADECTSRQVV